MIMEREEGREGGRECLPAHCIESSKRHEDAGHGLVTPTQCYHCILYTRHTHTIQ